MAKVTAVTTVSPDTRLPRPPLSYSKNSDEEFKNKPYFPLQMPDCCRIRRVGGGVLEPIKRHGGWHLPSGGQWLGIGWAPWRGGGGGYFPPFQCIPVRGAALHGGWGIFWVELNVEGGEKRSRRDSGFGSAVCA